MEEMKLTDEEIKTCVTYKLKSDQEKVNLGNLRIQCLQAEQKIIEAIVKSENELMTHIKFLAESKGVPTDDTWAFDFATFCFVKKSEV